MEAPSQLSALLLPSHLSPVLYWVIQLFFLRCSTSHFASAELLCFLQPSFLIYQDYFRFYSYPPKYLQSPQCCHLHTPSGSFLFESLLKILNKGLWYPTWNLAFIYLQTNNSTLSLWLFSQACIHSTVILSRYSPLDCAWIPCDLLVCTSQQKYLWKLSSGRCLLWKQLLQDVSKHPPWQSHNQCQEISPTHCLLISMCHKGKNMYLLWEWCWGCSLPPDKFSRAFPRPRSWGLFQSCFQNRIMQYFSAGNTCRAGASAWGFFLSSDFETYAQRQSNSFVVTAQEKRQVIWIGFPTGTSSLRVKDLAFFTLFFQC